MKRESNMSCFIVPTDTIDRIISTIELQGGWARHAAELAATCLFDWNALGRAQGPPLEHYGVRDVAAPDEGRGHHAWVQILFPRLGR